ncbi:DNA repair protein RAD51 homolog 3 [Musca vetustissima]|uniref:DNA repair protein RAD51 homolog 3 n=1 Tax=Musca vetustissima TaxID=27455 RepID=UPI002AB719A1|nr:DNA repair protein RAD51 homolog 3 [Musca vetustissima]
MFKQSAFAIWRKEQENKKIISLIKDLDVSLDGGIPLGQITEFCGSSGTGKTQLCLQLCINVQLPQAAGGLGGKAFYIDTNQGFSPFRLKEIAEHMEARCQRNSTKCHNFNLTTILNNITYVYCNNYCALMASILNLHNLLQEEHEEIPLKLMVIDSYAFVLRQLDDVDLRTRVNYEILTDLHNLAMKYGIAIVITNELTTRCRDNTNWFVCTALGDTHTHKINTRLLLSKDSNEMEDCAADQNYHIVMIEKSVVCKRMAFRFKIKPSGIHSITTRQT